LVWSDFHDVTSLNALSLYASVTLCRPVSRMRASLGFDMSCACARTLPCGRFSFRRTCGRESAGTRWADADRKAARGGCVLQSRQRRRESGSGLRAHRTPRTARFALPLRSLQPNCYCKGYSYGRPQPPSSEMRRRKHSSRYPAAVNRALPVSPSTACGETVLLELALHGCV
jgi:hypothetical protein